MRVGSANSTIINVGASPFLLSSEVDEIGRLELSTELVMPHIGNLRPHLDGKAHVLNLAMRSLVVLTAQVQALSKQETEATHQPVIPL